MYFAYKHWRQITDDALLGLLLETKIFFPNTVQSGGFLAIFCKSIKSLKGKSLRPWDMI